MPRKQPTIEDLVQERYADPEVQNAVLEDVQRLEHEDKILSGELRLPDEQAAEKWHAEKTGKVQLTPQEQRDQARLIALEQQVKELTDLLKNPNPERRAVLEQRIQELSNPKGE